MDLVASPPPREVQLDRAYDVTRWLVSELSL